MTEAVSNKKKALIVRCTKIGNNTMRDMTVGKEYLATPLTYGSHEADGCLVTDEDAVSLVDDTGDTVFLSIRLGLELIEESAQKEPK